MFYNLFLWLFDREKYKENLEKKHKQILEKRNRNRITFTAEQRKMAKRIVEHDLARERKEKSRSKSKSRDSSSNNNDYYGDDGGDGGGD